MIKTDDHVIQASSRVFSQELLATVSSLAITICQSTVAKPRPHRFAHRNTARK